MARPSMGPLPFSARPGNQSHELSTVSRDEFLAMKNRYLNQNRALAMQNSTMAAKITEMELRIAEFAKERVLTKERAALNSNYKAQLDETVLRIESTIVDKVDGIFQYLKDLRSREGLPANPQLELLSDRPVTSTPLNFAQGSGFSPFGLKLLESHEFQEGVAFPTKGFEPSRSTSPFVTGKQTFERSGSPSSSELGNETIDYLDELSAVGKPHDLSTLQETINLHNEDDEKSDPEVQVKKPAKEPPQKPLKGRLQKSKGKKVAENQISVLKEASAPNMAAKKQLPALDTARKAASSSPDSEPRRPTRDRKPVTYTVSLRDKMRRQSAKMVDAVHIDEEPCKIKQEPIARKRVPLGVVTNNANQAKSSNAKEMKKGSQGSAGERSNLGVDEGAVRRAKKRRLTVV